MTARRLAAAFAAGALALSGCTFLERSDVADPGLPQPQTSATAGDLSANGRYAAVSPYAPLVASDTNDLPDVYVRDHLTDTTERISVAAAGGDPNGSSGGATISGDGRFVLFTSDATNLLASGPTPAGTNLFVRDRTAGTTRLVSVTNDGQPIDGFMNNLVISADGGSIMVTVAATNVGAGGPTDEPHVFAHDLDSGVTEQIDLAPSGEPADSSSFGHGISGDGNLVVFETASVNMVPGTDGASNVYLRNRSAGTTELVSVALDGAAGNGSSGYGGGTTDALTTDGRFVLFSSSAADLTPGDTPSTTDLFVRDLTTDTTERVVTTSGVAAPAFIFPQGLSDDGRYLIGLGIRTSLQDLQPYIIDRVEQRRSYAATTPAQIPYDPEGHVGAISADGAYVEFDLNTRPGTFLRSTVVPTLSAASPSTAARGATVAVTLTGTYLFADPFVSFSGDGVAVTNVTVLDEQHVRVTVQVAPDAATGKRTAFLQNQGTGAGPRSGGLTVLVDALEVV